MNVVKRFVCFLLLPVLTLSFSCAGCSDKKDKSADAPPAGRRITGRNVPVIGVKSAALFTTKEMKNKCGNVPAGTVLTVVKDVGETLEVKTKDGTKQGWIMRCRLCSEAEYFRRKDANEVPVRIGYVKAEGKKVFIYGGRFKIMNNAVMLNTPGQGIWANQSAKGKQINIGMHRVHGNAKVLFFVNDKREVKKLPIWPGK